VGDDGEVHDVKSEMVNDYLQAVSGEDYTAKDFRTWAGTVLAAGALAAPARAESRRQASRHVARAVESVAARLGNTPTICRKSYVHPAVIEAYLDGSLGGMLEAAAATPRPKGLRPDEAAVLALLVRRLRREAKQVA
jgi:DNA topoisomerase-1